MEKKINYKFNFSLISMLKKYLTKNYYFWRKLVKLKKNRKKLF